METEQKHTPTPWKFERNKDYVELARLQNRPTEKHEGYPRHNNGDWIITDAQGIAVCRVVFRSKAKRGEEWHAPDPEGLGNAEFVLRAVNTHDGMLRALKALVDAVAGEQEDEEELAKVGRFVPAAVKDARAAIAAAEGGEDGKD